jgi:hypothetical protein
VSVKSEEYFGTSKLRTRIGAIEKKTAEMKKALGETVYVMYKNDAVNIDEIRSVCDQIRALDNEVALLEKEIAEIQQAGRKALGEREEEIRCPSCGASCIAGMKFCASCGANLPGSDMKKCVCGQDNVNGSKFCIKCGAALE